MAAKVPTCNLHFVGRQVRGQWIVSCLDFDLAAQDDTFDGAKLRIADQIKTYIDTATTLDGGIHAEQLLNRKAPLNEWLLFYAGSALQFCHTSFLNVKGYKELVPQPCPKINRRL
jgi:hypothetical protein